MAKIVLRFYGRFVFAEPFKNGESVGELNVLAINPQFNSDVPSDAHHVVMSAPRTCVSSPGTRPPDFKVMAAIDPYSAEHAVWNLTGQDLTVESREGYKWADRSNLIDLSELTRSEGIFGQTHLSASNGSSPISARIHLSGGTGTARQLVDGLTVDFVPLKQENIEEPPIHNKQLADMVEVPLDVEDSLRIRISRRGGGPVSAVAFTTNAAQPTVISFSNLCAGSCRQSDEEFAGFYEVLENPPLVRDRLVPRVQSHLEVPWGNCFPGVYMRYSV